MQTSILRWFASVTAALAALNLFAGVFAPSRLHAADALAAPPAKDATIDEAVVDFLQQTTNARLAAIELAHMAQARASAPSLSVYARGLQGQESLLLDRLQTLAARLGVELPAAINEKNTEKLGKLQAKSPEDFEKAFWDFLSDTYQRDLGAFEFATTVANLEVRQFAIQYRDMFQRQLDEIAKLTKAET